MPRKLACKGKSEFTRKMRRATHGKNKHHQQRYRGDHRGKAGLWPTFIFLPLAVCLIQPHFLVQPLFFLHSYNLGMITPDMWSKFKKVDLGKRAGYRHWICTWHHLGREFPGFRSQIHGLLEGEAYSITVSLFLGLPSLSP